MDNMHDDRATAIALEPRNLKALAHPLRLKLLGLLREQGPATASLLAQRTGESSGSTSYHLRQLAAFGFVEEDSGRASQRERWWRARHASTAFDETALFRDAATGLLAGEFMRAVVQAHSRRALEWVERLAAGSGQTAEAQAVAGTVSDWNLALTAAQCRSLQAELEAVIRRYPDHRPDEARTEGATLVTVQLHVLPRGPTAEQGGTR